MAESNSTTIVVNVPEAQALVRKLNTVISSLSEIPTKFKTDGIENTTLKGAACNSLTQVTQDMLGQLNNISVKCKEVENHMRKAILEYQNADRSLGGIFGGRKV